MRKYIVCFLTLFLICFYSVFPALAEEKKEAAKEAGNLDINAKSAVIMEPMTGKILFQKNQYEMFAPASVTKIMTILHIYD